MTAPVKIWRYVLPPEADRFSGWAIVLMDSSGMMATVSDFGNFAYKWPMNGWGPRDFRDFIARCDGDYIRRKLAPGTEYDGEATLLSAKRAIVDQRRMHARLQRTGGKSGYLPNELGRPLTRDEAREEWDRLGEFSNLDAEGDMILWAQHTRVNYFEGVSQRRALPMAVAFCERALPRLQTLLRAALAAEEAGPE